MKILISEDYRSFALQMCESEGTYTTCAQEWNLMTAALATVGGHQVVQDWIAYTANYLAPHHVDQIIEALESKSGKDIEYRVRLRSETPITAEYPMAIYHLCIQMKAQSVIAIKFLREMYALGLREAKNLFDAILEHSEATKPQTLGDLLRSSL